MQRPAGAPRTAPPFDHLPDTPLPLRAAHRLLVDVDIAGARGKKISRIAKAVVANASQITMATAAVALLIDDKIASLDRSNSEEAGKP
jgi:hypothetical protein